MAAVRVLVRVRRRHLVVFDGSEGRLRHGEGKWERAFPLSPILYGDWSD